MPVQYTVGLTALQAAIAANLVAIQLNETEAAAANRDTLVMIDLGTIIADVTGLAGASVADISDAIWDEVMADHLTAGTTGWYLDDVRDSGNDIENIINTTMARRTAYAYQQALANGVTFVPPAGTSIMIAHLTAAGGGNFEIMHAGNVVKENIAGDQGFANAVWCDGTDVGFRNSQGNPQTLSLEGNTP